MGGNWPEWPPQMTSPAQNGDALIREEVKMLCPSSFVGTIPLLSRRAVIKSVDSDG